MAPSDGSFPDDAECECGHLFDEHGETWDCQVESCGCVGFESTDEEIE